VWLWAGSSCTSKKKRKREQREERRERNNSKKAATNQSCVCINGGQKKKAIAKKKSREDIFGFLAYPAPFDERGSLFFGLGKPHNFSFSRHALFKKETHARERFRRKDEEKSTTAFSVRSSFTREREREKRVIQ